MIAPDSLVDTTTMPVDDTILDQVTAMIEADPRSGQALLLFGLISTLNTAKTGHVYLLNKLAEMQPDTRQLAYGLMELMAVGGTQDQSWHAATERINNAIAAR